jgi:hypothetical protein
VQVVIATDRFSVLLRKLHEIMHNVMLLAASKTGLFLHGHAESLILSALARTGSGRRRSLKVPSLLIQQGAGQQGMRKQK